jgi:hypothetical protein
LRPIGLVAGAVAATLLAGTGGARASIIISLEGAPQKVAGGFAYTYDAVLDPGQKIDPKKNAGFGTVYDFGNVVGSIAATGLLASDFTFTLDLTDKAAALTAPTDDPTLLNIRFTFTGSGSLSAQDLGTFTVISPDGPTTRSVNFDGQATKDVPGDPNNNSVASNIGFVSAPDPEAVPEPSTIAALGAAMLALGVVRRRRNSTPD